MKTTFYSICLLLAAALLLVACSPLMPAASPQGGATATPQGDAGAGQKTYPAPGVTVQPGGGPAVNPRPGAYPAPGPNGDLLAAFIEGASLALNKSNPPQAVLTLSGNLPTPCHQLVFSVAPPDKDNQVLVKLSIRDPDPQQMCTQVLTPLSQEVPLGNLPAGKYRVLVNGSLVGEISLP